MRFSIIIMAGGIGKRMKSKKVKVLHEILDKPLVWYVIQVAKSISPEKIVVVYGKNGEEIYGRFEDVEYAYQDEPLGTADAVKRGLQKLEGFDGDILVLSGDVILLRKETLNRLIDEHNSENADCTVLTFIPKEPSHYGRIVREEKEILKIVEEKDATEEERKIKEVNSGIYIFKKKALLENIIKVDNRNAQNEYYLTDVIGKIKESKGSVIGVVCDDPTEVEGVNTREELSNVERIMKNRIIKCFQDQGVTFHFPETIYVTPEVMIGRDTEIFPFNIFKGNTKIGENCIIEPYCYLKNAVIPDGMIIKRGTIIDD